MAVDARASSRVVLLALALPCAAGFASCLVAPRSLALLGRIAAPSAQSWRSRRDIFFSQKTPRQDAMMAGDQFLVVASLNMLGDAYNAFEY